MNKYNKLLSRIASDLNILKGSSESVDAWKARIVYSAIGHMAFASLYDVQEDDNPVSITHFKRRVEKLYNSFISMYPELKTVFLIQADELADEIYNVFLQAGCLYHSPNRITATVPQVACSNQIAFMRGTALKQKVFRSGLGAYLPALKPTGDSITVTDLFCLQRSTLSSLWERTVTNIKWSEITLSTKTEYLRTTPPYNSGYFKEQPDKDGRISILRTGMPGSYLYYFYTYQANKILGMQIPAWQVDNVDNSAYRTLSNCCIYSEGHLPPAIYHVDQGIVSLRLQYLYPPSELNMIKLYSWPLRYYNFGSFNRILTGSVFFAIKSELERIGYGFVEE